ncbi:chromosome partitioning protein [Maritimibacter sp. 55A14]|uniref:CpsD/CapB family tyrosine-protein kinase n=1 Tax=Maritimibacter sp. 55A14 TaxID=2174844 RepID=UPI000D611C0C|nr:CpsD/CapB family tyrosine-protein kinase [Maritimibacter sp. 55A14]PWE32982.1 chromosome partitioning protein [Maritimibacter sp. 55A14]
MDRLQMALEKARAKREQAGAPGPETRPFGDGSKPSAVEPAKPEPPREKQATPVEMPEVWKVLAPLHINEKEMIQNRLVSLQGGPEAAPYDMLRTKIAQQARVRGWRRIALVSPHSACGKSTTAANLGFSFGRQEDKRTMVLDFDLRRMGLARILAQRCQNSMGDVLTRRVSFQAHALRHGHNVIFGLNCSEVSNPSEILQSRQADEVLSEIEDTYEPDFVFFDTPPLMASDDSHGFLKNVDCALLIAAAEQTTMDEIDVAERQLAELTNVMGIVLNKCRYTSGAHGYEYGYY